MKLYQILHTVWQNVYHALTNQHDGRFWVRTLIFCLFDWSLLIATTIENWNEALSISFLLLANFGFLISAILGIRTCRVSLAQRNALNMKFKELDTDNDHLLTTTEVIQLIESFPSETFKEFRLTSRNKRPKQFTVDKLAKFLHPKRERSLIYFVFEFLANWLSFFASLILFDRTTGRNPLIVTQGVIAVIELSFIMHHTLRVYLSKYRIIGFFSLAVFFIYWSQFFTVVFCFFSGYTITVVLADELPLNQSNGQIGSIASPSAPGFFTGWVLTAIIFLLFVNLSFCFFCFSACGLLRYRGRRSFRTKVPKGKSGKKSAELASSALAINSKLDNDTLLSAVELEQEDDAFVLAQNTLNQRRCRCCYCCCHGCHCCRCCRLEYFEDE